MNENQNIYVRNGRPTSRVLNRPGGNCQISLGGYTEEELEQMRKRRDAQKNAAALNATIGTENQKKITTNEKLPSEPTKEKEGPSNAKKSVSQKSVASTALPSGRRNDRISSNAFASSSTTNSYNVLTDRPTSRVSNPPGGKTNFTLG